MKDRAEGPFSQETGGYCPREKYSIPNRKGFAQVLHRRTFRRWWADFSAIMQAGKGQTCTPAGEVHATLVS
jgi:hypothetical protein